MREKLRQVGFSEQMFRDVTEQAEQNRRTFKAEAETLIEDGLRFRKAAEANVDAATNG